MASKSNDYFKKLGQQETQEKTTVDSGRNQYLTNQHQGRGRGNSDVQHGGRGRGGRGGRGLGYVLDPHNGTYPPPMKWSEEAQACYTFMIEKIDEGVEESAIADLNPREGDSVLMKILSDLIKNSNKCTKSMMVIMKNIRVWNRYMLIDAINRQSAFMQAIEMIESNSYGYVVIGTPPANLSDLYTAEANRAIYVDAKGDNEQRRKAILKHQLIPYITRMYLNTDALVEVIKGLEKVGAGEINNLANIEKHMMKYMFIHGGVGTQFAPVQRPVNTGQKPKSDNAGGPATSKTPGEFAKNEDKDVFDYEEQTAKAWIEETTKENTISAEVEEKEKSESATSLEKKHSTNDEIELYEKSLNEPNSILNIERKALTKMKEADMKAFLSEKLQSYLRAHYGDQSSELLELTLRENTLRISDIVMEEGELRELAKQNGITPTMNVERDSPKKIAGSHPLSSNKVRKFTVQCSKQNMGSNRPYDIAIEILKLLFTAIRTVQQHEIALLPIRSNSGAPKLWDTDLIAREQHKLMGTYIDNVQAQQWNGQTKFEICLESTMDIHFLFQKSFSREILGNGNLQLGMKKMEVSLKVIDVDESSKDDVALIYKSTKYDSIESCKKEIVDRLSDTTSLDITEKDIDIEWRSVTDPADENIKAMIGVVTSTEEVSTELIKKLLELNGSKDTSLHPHTGRWTFYRGQDDGKLPFPMSAGIRHQRNDRKLTENFSVSGLADFDLAEYIPSEITEGYKNTALKNVLQLLREGHGMTETFLFEGVYKKSNDEYLFVGQRNNEDRIMLYFENGSFQKSMKTWLQDHGSFKKETALTINANTYSDGKVSRKRKTLTIGNYMAEIEKNAQMPQAITRNEGDNMGNSTQLIPAGMPPFPLQTIPAPYHTSYPISRGKYEDITLSTISMGTIAKSELTQIINCVMQHVRAEMDRAFSVLDPSSRLLACLDDRDNRLQQDLENRESKMYEKLLTDIGAMLENKSTDTKRSEDTASPETTKNNTAETGEGVSTEIKAVAQIAIEELDDAQKALNFDQYASKTDKSPLTPATEQLKKKLMETPLVENWEDKADGKLEQELHQINNEIATLEKSDDKLESQGEASPGDTAEESTVEKSENQGDALRESQTPIKTKAPYSLGFGDDDHSTTSDIALGLDTKSLDTGANHPTKPEAIRVSARIRAQTSSDEENEKDAT